MMTFHIQTLQRRRQLYRVAIPIAALSVFAIFALLWATGFQSVAFTLLRILGVEPHGVPFLDTEAVLAAAECHQRGIDVYLSNPCDTLGRVHAYSPLWLAIIPPMFGTTATPWIGAALDLLFILLLPILIRGRDGREIVVLTIAIFSPMTVYALERANNDLVVFLMVVAGGLLLSRRSHWRFCSYAVFAAAALLKYYPAILLVMAARERRRDVVLVAVGAAAAAALFAVFYHAELGHAWANIPLAERFTDSFSAQNLPFGLIENQRVLRLATPAADGLLAILAIFAVLRARRMAAMLNALRVDWNTRHLCFAAIGSLLITGCFFAGQNINYRGIYFLFVLPGLLELYTLADSGKTRRLLSLLIAATLFVMWDEFFRRALMAGLSQVPSPALANHCAMLFWVVRELIWWWLIAGLAAVSICYLIRQPLLDQACEGLVRRWPGLGARLATGSARVGRAEPTGLG
jgi:hypothetical protein